MIAFDVVGTPAPQGSKRGFVVNGRAVLVESSKKVKPWRQDVKAACIAAMADSPFPYPMAGPVELTIVFYMPRPGYHFRSGARAHELKPTAPTFADKRPDLSKLVRSTEDALTEAGVYRDDAQVVVLAVSKEYSNAATGAHIRVALMDDAGATLPPVSDGSVQEALL